MHIVIAQTRPIAACLACMTSLSRILLLVLLLVSACAQHSNMTQQVDLPALLPLPQSLQRQPGQLHLGADAVLVGPKSLGGALQAEIHQRFGCQLPLLERAGPAQTGIVLQLDSTCQADGYQLGVQGTQVILQARDLAGLAQASATLLQLLQSQGQWLSMSRVEIQDAPSHAWRGVMLDCARHWQSPQTLRQVVRMCWLFKIRYLHLHLTDDSAFTFPSSAYPQLVSSKLHYSLEALQELEAYAVARGVTLVPEIDVPGHSRALVRAMPETFACGDAAGSLLNMGKESAYAALDTLLGEIAAVFQSSPYIHIGGDEVGLEMVASDADCQAYMQAQGLPNAQELYRHFLCRMHDIVHKHGKQAMCWEGFKRKGKVQIPKDMIVFAWDTSYQRPDQLLAAGYQIINASWQPLYIVGGGFPNPRRWPAQEIYQWNPRLWQHFAPKAPSFAGLQLPRDAEVLGGQICVWEQLESSVLADLQPRLAALAARLWNPAAENSWPDFKRRYDLIR